MAQTLLPDFGPVHELRNPASPDGSWTLNPTLPQSRAEMHDKAHLAVSASAAGASLVGTELLSDIAGGYPETAAALGNEWHALTNAPLDYQPVHDPSAFPLEPTAAIMGEGLGPYASGALMALTLHNLVKCLGGYRLTAHKIGALLFRPAGR